MGNCGSLCDCEEENSVELSTLSTSQPARYSSNDEKAWAEFNFAVRELERIRKTWDKAKSSTNIGLDIIISMIRRKPMYAEYLGVKVEEYDSDQQIRKEEKLIAQGDRIQGLLDTVICCLGHLPESHVRAMCYRVGSVHYYRRVNFSADIWLIFKRIIIEEILKHTTTVISPKLSVGKMEIVSRKTSNTLSISWIGETEEGTPLVHEEREPMAMRTGFNEAVWNKLLTLIFQEMKRGFLEQAIKSCTN